VATAFFPRAMAGVAKRLGTVIFYFHQQLLVQIREGEKRLINVVYLEENDEKSSSAVANFIIKQL
jgi:hypothetical protein